MRRTLTALALLAVAFLWVCAPAAVAADVSPPAPDGDLHIAGLMAPDRPLMDSGMVFEPYDPHLGFPQAFPGTLPSTGMVRFPVILIEFSDYPATDSIADLEEVLNGPGDSAQFPCESLHGYFSRSSYGKLDLYGDVLGVYRVPYARSAVVYEHGDKLVVAAQKIVVDALDHFDGLGTDFSQYDQDENGLMDYVVVFWTGPEESRDSLWWGFATDYGSEAYDGLELGVWGWMTEPPLDTIELPARTVIHETAHALGLPDYYDYDDSVGPQGGVGVWDMMGRGAGDLNAFSKILLGWINPEVVAAGSQRFVLRPASRYADALIVMPEFSLDRPQREFFLIQAWDGSENDSFYLRFAKSRFPDVRPGLLIWHVDATPLDATGFFHNNSYTEHKLLRLMEADGLEEIEASMEGTAGDSGDVYRTGASFGPTTKPSSEPYWGSSSGVSLTDVTHAGDGITFTVSIGANDLDLVPPVTTDNHAGLDLFAPATISLTATDAGSGMSGGPAHTEYRVDGGEYQVGTTVTLNGGVHTLAYRSMDNAGNLESPEKSVSVVVLSSKPVFIDIANSPYLVAIQSMAALKVLSGYSDHTFRPSNPVTRQQFAKMVVKTLGLEVTGAEVSPFTDVVKQVGSDPFYPSKYVAVCAAAGITQGTSATTFAPSASITRQQLITMVVRAAGLEGPPAGYLPGFGGPQFSLAEHYQNARKAAYAGLLDGLAGVGASYDFVGAATRGECAQLLWDLAQMSL